MAVFASNDNSHGSSTRSVLIVGLLALILALVLGMAWQANRSVQAHNETAIGVLEDYAGLAADEYSRRAMATAGYYGYYNLMSSLRATAAKTPDDLVAGPTSDRPSGESPSLYVFSVRLADKKSVPASTIELSSATRAYILQDLVPLANGELPESSYVVTHTNIDDKQHSFVVSWTDDASLLFGFEVNREWLTRVLNQAFTEGVLLPESLAGGAMTNDLLYLQMRDSVGGVLFETGTSIEGASRVSKTLLDEYGGVFREHVLTAAIDPALAQSLIIGGLPKSQLPAIVAIILLATALLIAAIWQLQRENAVTRMRADFVAEVSHELRTPLTQIRMFTESLLFERLRSTVDKRRALSIINRESQRLIHMVENILQFSDGKRSRGDLVVQAEDLRPIVESVVDEFQTLADTSDTTVECSAESAIIARVDVDAIRQVLLNLLDNAVKYGPQGQTVTVALRGYSDVACLVVTDQGPGIPVSMRDRIWDAYYRLDRERDSAVAGTGIGLAVVGDLVSKHNGTVRVENSESGGARFVIELPL